MSCHQYLSISGQLQGIGASCVAAVTKESRWHCLLRRRSAYPPFARITCQSPIAFSRCWRWSRSVARCTRYSTPVRACRDDGTGLPVRRIPDRFPRAQVRQGVRAKPWRRLYRTASGRARRACLRALRRRRHSPDAGDRARKWADLYDRGSAVANARRNPLRVIWRANDRYRPRVIAGPRGLRRPPPMLARVRIDQPLELRAGPEIQEQADLDPCHTQVRHLTIDRHGHRAERSCECGPVDRLQEACSEFISRPRRTSPGCVA